MRQPWIAAVALLATACAPSAPAVCGACQGPHYATTGFPVGRAADSVRVCIDAHGCRTTDHPHLFGLDSQDLGPLPVPAGDLDGRRLTVVVSSGQDRWRGSSTLHDVPRTGGTCSCSGGLKAEVPLEPRAPLLRSG